MGVWMNEHPYGSQRSTSGIVPQEPMSPAGLELRSSARLAVFTALLGLQRQRQTWLFLWVLGTQTQDLMLAHQALY